MGGCCGLVCGYTSEVVDVAEDSGSLAVELPGDEVGDILAVNCCPTEANWQADVSVVSSVEGEANQWPVPGVQGKLPVGPSHMYEPRKDSLGVPLLMLTSGGKGQLRSIMTHLSGELHLGWVRSGLVWHQGVKGG